MFLFEIHQRFKSHFLNELRVSFKEILSCADFSTWFEVDGLYITVLTASSSVSTSDCCLRRKQIISERVLVSEPLSIRMEFGVTLVS